MTEFLGNIYVQFGFGGLLFAVFFWYSFQAYKKTERHIKEQSDINKDLQSQLNNVKNDYLNYVKNIAERSSNSLDENTTVFKEIIKVLETWKNP